MRDVWRRAMQRNLLVLCVRPMPPFPAGCVAPHFPFAPRASCSGLAGFFVVRLRSSVGRKPMTKPILMLATVALLFSSSWTLAKPADTEYTYRYTGNTVFQRCNNNRPFVYGFGGALTDVMHLLQSNKEIAPIICIPTAVQNGQIADTMCNYLEKHPEQRHLLAVDLAISALSEAFPCKW